MTIHKLFIVETDKKYQVGKISEQMIYAFMVASNAEEKANQ